MQFRLKAFTLIELLVVVAIIGILAAVGVVAYNGYTKAAKKNVTKSNHKLVVKYAAAELAMCQLGEEYIMEEQFGTGVKNPYRLKCEKRTWAIQHSNTGVKGGYATRAITQAFIDLKNPYGGGWPAVISRAGIRQLLSVSLLTTSLGYSEVTDDGTKVTIVTCWDEPCTGTNVMTNTVPIE